MRRLVLAAAAPLPVPPPPPTARTLYLTLLTWAFTLFSTVRVFAYLPTLWAIHDSGESTQHSLWTWLIWAGANSTMAAWLYEQAQQRFTSACAVNIANATMCTATLLLIVAYRF